MTAGGKCYINAIWGRNEHVLTQTERFRRLSVRDGNTDKKVVV